MSKLIETVIFTDTVMEDFEKRGYAAPHVYYELLEEAQKYITGHSSSDEFLEYSEFVFGMDGKRHLNRLKKKSDMRYREIISMIDGTYDPESRDRQS